MYDFPLFSKKKLKHLLWPTTFYVICFLLICRLTTSSSEPFLVLHLNWLISVLWTSHLFLTRTFVQAVWVCGICLPSLPPSHLTSPLLHSLQLTVHPSDRRSNVITLRKPTLKPQTYWYPFLAHTFFSIIFLYLLFCDRYLFLLPIR